MRRLPLLIVMAALLFGLARPVQAQSGVVVSGIRVEYNFGVQITFSAQIQSFSPIQEILLLFRDEHETVTRVYPAQLDANGQASYRYDASQNALRPFAPIQFWFQVTLQNGQSYSSQNYTFIYADNRFDWQALEDGALHVHWYAGDAAFGQAALDTSRAGLQRIGELIPLNLDQPIEVYLRLGRRPAGGALAGRRDLGGRACQSRAGRGAGRSRWGTAAAQPDGTIDPA